MVNGMAITKYTQMWDEVTGSPSRACQLNMDILKSA